MTDSVISKNGSTSNKNLGYVAGVLMIVFAPAGVILSYIDRQNSSALLKTHYSYLIGTFWKGLLFGLISAVLAILVIGMFLWIATSIWYLARCIKSLVLLHRDQPISNPSSWTL